MRSRSDEGVALVTVMLVGLAMIILTATALTVAGSGLRQAATEQQSVSAFDAAYAGVEDYLARLNQNPGYVQYGNASSTFSYPSRNELEAPKPWNPAFGVGVTVPGDDATSWATVPGSALDDGRPAQFRYEVDTTQYRTSGVVRLRVTGLSGQRTRTLLASIRVRGFVDFTYFTDYEIIDPQVTGAPASCAAYVWNGRPAKCGGVDDPFFGPNDQINGDLHSNDTLKICSTKVNGKVTTANQKAFPNGLYYDSKGCAITPVDLQREAVLAMPKTNSTMQQDAGCVYTGPTKVTYTADGYMTVVSPWTTSIAPRCGSVSALRTAAGARVKQLDQDALYVQDVPAGAARPADLRCIDTGGATTDAPDGIGWSLTTGGTTVRYPLAGESPATFFQDSTDKTLWSTTNVAYGCRKGDLYVSGTVTTQTTAGAANLVYITGDVAYLDRTKDLLGLVPQNAAIVWNPMSATDQPMLTKTDGTMDFNRSIDAAIVSVARSFMVQNYNRYGTRGTLSTFGTVAQKFRGPAGRTGSAPTGYTKAYQYDPLLRTVSPPKFLAPAATSFAVTRYATVPLAFTASGKATGS